MGISQKILHNLVKLTQEETEKLNGFVFPKEIEFIVKNLSTKKTPGPAVSLLNSTKCLSRNNVSLLVQSLSHVQLFVTPWTAAHQASLSFTISWSLLKHMSIELVVPSSHLIVCCLLLLLPSVFPCIRVFSRVGSSHQAAKVLELQLQHQSFQ